MQVNERGKVSSRPGPQSPKDVKKQQKAAAEATAAAAAAAPPQPAAASSPDATAARPVSSPPSSSGSGDVQRIQAPARQGPMETPQVVVDRMFGRVSRGADTGLVRSWLLQ